MNNKKLTVLIATIEGLREALPIRAVPFVTSWQRFTPDFIETYLSRKTVTSKNSTLFANRVLDGKIETIEPQEWDERMVDMRVYEAKLRKRKIKRETPDNEPPSDTDIETYDIWRKDSIKLLPAGVFLWLDEFRAEFKAENKKVLFEAAHQNDADLILNPMEVDAITRKVIMEGFKFGNKLRTNELDCWITKAIKQAKSMEAMIVYPKLKDMALCEEGPFTGDIEEGTGALFYTNGRNKVAKLTRKALESRLARRRANGETPPLSPVKPH